ncbi:hypothetical protein [Aquisalimonas sp.]|uniref:hypothetical protein n=1 Tax=Aquisalimonas sp. TaxID=1872621 RepID=UPI0025BDF602|nr:hypothetical protein [Aquisalimonas sp.]
MLFDEFVSGCIRYPASRIGSSHKGSRLLASDLKWELLLLIRAAGALADHVAGKTCGVDPESPGW